MANVFMNNLTEADWRNSLTAFRNTLTDSVIVVAVHRFPPEIYAIRGPVISAKLKSRRESLTKKGLIYYSFISKKVNILGGNGDDLFRLSRNDSGLLVQVYTVDSNHTKQLTFSRTFDPHITKE